MRQKLTPPDQATFHQAAIPSGPHSQHPWWCRKYDAIASLCLSLHKGHLENPLAESPCSITDRLIEVRDPSTLGLMAAHESPSYSGSLLVPVFGDGGVTTSCSGSIGNPALVNGGCTNDALVSSTGKLFQSTYEAVEGPGAGCCTCSAWYSLIWLISFVRDAGGRST